MARLPTAMLASAATTTRASSTARATARRQCALRARTVAAGAAVVAITGGSGFVG
jgi:hypothetical protein